MRTEQRDPEGGQISASLGPGPMSTPFSKKVAAAAAARTAQAATNANYAASRASKAAGDARYAAFDHGDRAGIYAATERVLGSPMPTEADAYPRQKYGLIVRKYYEDEDIPRDFFRRMDNLGPDWPPPPPPPPKPKPPPAPEQRASQTTEINIPEVNNLIVRIEVGAQSKRAYAQSLRADAKLVRCPRESER